MNFIDYAKDNARIMPILKTPLFLRNFKIPTRLYYSVVSNLYKTKFYSLTIEQVRTNSSVTGSRNDRRLQEGENQLK